MAAEIRYGKFGAYFHDGDDLGLNEVLIRLGDGEHLRREVQMVLEYLDGLAYVWGDEAVMKRCRDRLRAAVEFQSELVSQGGRREV